MSDDSRVADGGTSAEDWRDSVSSSSDSDGSMYVESQLIMITVRVVSPFAFTYGLFLVFHGADSPGGSFQGGAVIAATVLMIAFAFGVTATRDWLRNRTVVALAAGGTATFALVGLVPMLFGDSFLAHPRIKRALDIKTKWGLEAIEVGGVAPIVTGVLVGLFFVLAAGLRRDADEQRTDGGTAGHAALRGSGGGTGDHAGQSGPGGSPADDTTEGDGQ